MKGALFVSRYMKTEKLWVLFHRVAIRHTGCVYKWDILMKVKESFVQSAGHPCHSSSCWSDKILTISWSINMQLWIIGLNNVSVRVLLSFYLHYILYVKEHMFSLRHSQYNFIFNYSHMVLFILVRLYKVFLFTYLLLQSSNFTKVYYPSPEHVTTQKNCFFID